MNEMKQLTQQKLQEILTYAYEKGQETEDIKVAELIEEIRQRVLMKK